MISPVFFTAPWWLLGLIPWAGLTLYLLQGRAAAISVPFLPLWQESNPQIQRTRAWRFPPLPIIATLAAALLAVVASAGPKIHWAGKGSTRPLIIIADRGITMSANHRLASAAAQSATLVGDLIGPGAASLIAVPPIGLQTVDRASFPAAVASLAPTAMDTQSDLETAERRALADPQALVIVLSDQAGGASDPRLVRIGPEESFSNIQITRLSVRAAPSPEAMIELENDSSDSQATLRVTGADPVVIQLPPRGKSASYFVDLPNAPQVVQATLGAGNAAWAVRTESWPTILPQCDIPEELSRFFDVYRRHRPSGNQSATVAILSVDSDLPSDQPAISIVPETSLTQSDSSPVHMAPSEITTGIDWDSAAKQAQAASIQPDSTWQKLVWTDRHTLLAFRTDPSRQVWIGFQPATWAATPDFVIFWTKVLDWVGQGRDRYESQTVGPLSSDWKPVGFTVAPSDNGLWPGLYQNGRKMIAANADAAHVPLETPNDWRGKLAQLISQQGAVVDAAPGLVLAALSFLILSARGLAGKPHPVAAYI